MTVQRWTPVHFLNHMVTDDENGSWVTYDDYVKLLNEFEGNKKIISTKKISAKYLSKANAYRKFLKEISK